MSKKIRKVWTKYGKWLKMGVQGGPENEENDVKVEVWKVVEKVGKNHENDNAGGNSFQVDETTSKHN